APFRGHAEVPPRIDPPRRELSQSRLRYPPLRIDDLLEHLLVDLVHILDLDAGLDALVLADADGGADFLLGQRDVERAERGEVGEVAEFALGLLDLGPPYAEFALGFEQLLD